MLNKLLPPADTKFKLLIIPLICSLFYFPILYAGVFFADDIYRINVPSGGFNWEWHGRFLATLIAYIYSGTTNMVVDAYPLTWFINTFLFSFSIYLVYLKINNEAGASATWISVLLLINPFFTYNLFYRFDSIGMTLAITFAILAFYAPDSKNYFWIKVILLLISLNFYQSGINLFLSIYALFFFLSISKESNIRDFLKKYIFVILVYVSASILYYIELKILPMSNRSALIPLDKYLLPTIINNHIKALKPFIEFWSYYKWYIVPILPFSLVGLLTFIKKKTFIFIFLCLLLFCFSILGGLCLIKENAYYNNRVLNYFPFFIIFLYLGLNKLGDKFKYLIFLPVLACFLFNFRVGNVHRIQNLSEQPIFYSVSVDIYSHPEIKKFYVLGGVPISSFAKNLIKHTPFRAYLYRSSWNSAFRINEYVSRNIVENQWGDVHAKMQKKFKTLRNNNELELIKRNYPFYCIYKNNDIGYIDWGCETYEKK